MALLHNSSAVITGSHQALFLMGMKRITDVTTTRWDLKQYLVCVIQLQQWLLRCHGEWMPHDIVPCLEDVPTSFLMPLVSMRRRFSMRAWRSCTTPNGLVFAKPPSEKFWRTWSSFISSLRRWTGRFRISSSKASIFCNVTEVAGKGGWSSKGVAVGDIVWWRGPNNLARGLFASSDGTSVLLRISASGDNALIFRVLGDSRGEGKSTCKDLGRLEGLRVRVGVVGSVWSSRTSTRDGKERRSGRLSSEPSNSSNSCEISTSNIASYRFLECDLIMFRMCRGRMLYREYAASLLDFRSRWPAAKWRS